MQATEALHELPGKAQYQTALIGLAIAAIKEMAGEEFELVLRKEDRARLGEPLRAEVERKATEELGRKVRVRLSTENVEGIGGLCIWGAGGRQFADQRFESRLERLWPQVRCELAPMLFPELFQEGEEGRSGRPV
jgi:vacuolar-type H+-ATPase subunit E/Vma4